MSDLHLVDSIARRPDIFRPGDRRAHRHALDRGRGRSDLGPGAGLAATQMVHDLEHGRPAVRDAGKLIGRDARELAELALSDSPTERSIGFAALNALIEVDETACVDRNAEDLILERGRGRRRLRWSVTFRLCPRCARPPGVLGVGAELPARAICPPSGRRRSSRRPTWWRSPA